MALKRYQSPWPTEIARYKANYTRYKTTTGEYEEILVRYVVATGEIYSGSLRKANGEVYHARKNYGKWEYTYLISPWVSEDFPVDKQEKFLKRLKAYQYKGTLVATNFMFPKTYSELQEA